MPSRNFPGAITTLSQKLNASGVPVTYDRVEVWPHGMDFFSPVGERSLWHIYQFLKAFMPSDKMKYGEN